MRFSTKSRYGLRAMIELALHFNKEAPVSVKTIAEEQEISEAYLEHLMSTLARRRLAKSIRGAQGGYLLSKDPAKIKVGDVIRALEGDIVPVDCVNKEDPADCERFENCVSRIVWEKVQDAINDTLDSITLKDLLDELKARGKTRDSL
ncbi:MAG: RrF2 family transcriptional regulator [Bacillota bacterium]